MSEKHKSKLLIQSESQNSFSFWNEEDKYKVIQNKQEIIIVPPFDFEIELTDSGNIIIKPKN